MAKRPVVEKAEEIGQRLVESCESDPAVYSEVNTKLAKIKTPLDAIEAKVNNRQEKLQLAVLQTQEFQTTLDDFTEKLAKIEDDLEHVGPVSAVYDVVKRQKHKVEEARDDCKQLEPVFEKVSSCGNDVLESLEAGEEKDDLKGKLDDMEQRWKSVVELYDERQKALDRSLNAAEVFWPVLLELKAALKDVQDRMELEDLPSADLEALAEQQADHDELRKELDGHTPRVTSLCEASPALVENCSPGDRAHVQSELNAVTEQWEGIEKGWQKRRGELVEVKVTSEQYHKLFVVILVWLDELELKLSEVPPVGTELATVQEQLKLHKAFHAELTPHQSEITQINQLGSTVGERCRHEDSDLVHAQLEEVNHRWDELCNHSTGRQQKLEEALLQLGQFQLAFQELLVWLRQTDSTLDEQLAKKVQGDVKYIEIELAKHKILQNDILSHEPSVDSLSRAASALLESGETDSTALEGKVQELKTTWDAVLAKSAQRQAELEKALKDSHSFMSQIKELRGWLNEASEFLKSRRAIGGRPENATKQLNKHKDFMVVIETRQKIYVQIVEVVENLIDTADPTTAASLQRQLDELKTSWEQVTSRAAEESEKLEQALTNATSLEAQTSDMDQWLTRVDGVVSVYERPSTILVVLETQREEYKELKEDIDAHRDPYKGMRLLAHKISDVCIKEDGVYIEGIMSGLEERWKELLTTSSARKRSLDENYRMSSKFFGGVEDLMKMLDAAEEALKNEEPIGVDPAHLRTQLKKHKEFQTMLGANQAGLDATVKMGKQLMDRSLDEDAITIEGKIADLKARWDAVCGLSVERQQKLEEALLFTGMFQDALQSLLDWLFAVEPSLSTETAVMGDPETVQILIDNHKTFQRELGRREANYQSVMKAGRAMINENKVEEPAALEEKLADLRMRWDAVYAMSNTKQDRLENALVLAKEFDSSVKTELHILKQFEENLRELGPIAEDLEEIKEQMEKHRVFHDELKQEEVNVQSAVKKGQVILRFCHPSAIQIIQQWLARLKKRWDEVWKWSSQRLMRLEEELRKLAEEDELMGELLRWIQTKEEALAEKEKEPIPDDDYEEVHRLLEEHKVFQEEMAKKQPSYDRLTKSAKRRTNGSTTRTPEVKATPSRRGGAVSRIPRSSPAGRSAHNPAVSHLSKRWQHLWLLSMERLRRLQEKLERIAIKRASAKFNFPEWKSRFNKWLHDSKSRVQDIFRRMDHDRDGKLTREQFITGVLNTSFPTERWEMEIVASKFERNGLIDYKEFMNALKDKPSPEKPKTDAQKIHNEIDRQVEHCCCAKQFSYFKVGENKYRVSHAKKERYFGDSQKLRLLRILRSTVMVRVGGGWETLQEFLEKNDPCRAEGRTNLDLRAQLVGDAGFAESMATFKSKRPSLSREGSDIGGKPTRESSGTSLRGKPPSGARPKTSTSSGLTVPSVRREKSGELLSPRAPSIAKARSGSNLRAQAKSPTPGMRKTGSYGALKDAKVVSRSDSQSSIGSTGSREGEPEGTSPSSESRIPVGRTTKAPTTKPASKTTTTRPGTKAGAAATAKPPTAAASAAAKIPAKTTAKKTSTTTTTKPKPRSSK
ncbi:predicted protein [Nematostella vectensis]|uniref:Microtubule-actin cross-linking factor 1 n=1 Tax=Nematostella vectensis TaxID=45351 RepID=A7SF35_NEMVE|nr:predicted protein [Nematostella vectensis]|eukprot:XP_001629769.1 predicted protein [Nematostella vectensis]